MRLLVGLGILSGLAALLLASRHLPPEWDPRAPLDLTAEPNAVTRLKLARIVRDPDACFASFDASRIAVTRMPDREGAPGCGLTAVVRLPSGLRFQPSGPVVTCRMAAAWTLFERHGLQPAARRHLGTEVAGVRHLGTYNCRNVNHATSGRRSQHATANAIDISAFLLADGREVRLAGGWAGGGGPAAFLRDARDGACRWFGAVLGPDHDAAHADHFHLDLGPWRACR
jgi:hypothetical protein